MNNTITKETQKESYLTILESLGKRQQLIIEYLNRHNSATTASELAWALFKEGKVPTAERNVVHPRLNELVKMNVLEVTGKKLDSGTGRKVAVYKLLPNWMENAEKVFGEMS